MEPESGVRNHCSGTRPRQWCLLDQDSGVDAREILRVRFVVDARAEMPLDGQRSGIALMHRQIRLRDAEFVARLDER